MSVCCDSRLLFLLCYLWKTARWTEGSRLTYFICFAPQCWQKTDAALPQLAIYTGSCLQRSAGEPQCIGISVEGRAGSRLGGWRSRDRLWSPVTPGLGAARALLAGRDRALVSYRIALPMVNPRPNNVGHSLTGVWEPGFYGHLFHLHFEAAKVYSSVFCYPTDSPGLANLGLPVSVPVQV